MEVEVAAGRGWSLGGKLTVLLVLVFGVASLAQGEKNGPEGGGSSAISALEPLLLDLSGTREERRKAREELLRIGAPGATPVVLRLLNDSRWSLRWEGVNLLGYLEDPAAVQGLVDRVLHDENPHVRWRAIWAMAAVDPEGTSARPLLWQAHIETEKARVAWNATVGLSIYEDPRALPGIHAGLQSPSREILWEAVNALGRVHGPESSAHLEAFLRHPDPSLRRETVLVLSRICDEKARELLLASLEHADAQVRWRVAMGLGRCGGEAARRALQERRAVEKNSMVLEHIAQSLERLERTATLASDAAGDRPMKRRSGN